MCRSRLFFTALGALALGVGFTAIAHAAPSGEQVVAQKGCAACHGAKGEGNPQAGFPRLAGQPAAYLEAQLEAFSSGKRPNAIMRGQAQGLSSGDMRAIAEYYAALKEPAASGMMVDKTVLGAGREIVVNGLWQKNVPSCQACHGPGARGFEDFPALAGQDPKYIEAQLKAWQDGKRPGGIGDLMKHVAQALDAKQVHAVAEYLASLPPTGPIPADAPPDVAPTVADAMPGYFQPPLLKDLPNDKFGEAVKRGYLIFMDTPKYASKYVGNGQSCSNCHTNRGRQADSSPMWAARSMYPAFRGKNKRVNDLVMRLQGCFTYSENAPDSKSGSPPPSDSPAMIDLESYIHWMSYGVPTGVKMKGRGYPKLAEPPKPYSREQGKVVYAADCAVCHGGNGEGRKLADGSYIFPPLWGAQAFNWGAGMHSVAKAADFIHHNMPFGYPGKLSVQETWDVAAWIDSHPRPQDPRYKGNLDETIKAFHHNRKVDYYGKKVDGRVLGAPGTLQAWEKAQQPGD